MSRNIGLMLIACATLALLNTGRANAQTPPSNNLWYLGAAAGLNYANIRGDIPSTQWQLGANGKTMLGYQLNPTIAFQLETGISLKGTNYSYKVIDPVDSLYDDYTHKFTLPYIENSLLFRISIPLEKPGIIPYRRYPEPSLYMDILLGPYFSLYNFGGNLNQQVTVRQRYMGDTTIETTKLKNDFEMFPGYDINPMDLGLVAALAVRYDLSRSHRIFFEARYNMGFISADSGAFQVRGSHIPVNLDPLLEVEKRLLPKVNMKNAVLSANIGYQYVFRRKKL